MQRLAARMVYGFHLVHYEERKTLLKLSRDTTDVVIWSTFSELSMDSTTWTWCIVLISCHTITDKATIWVSQKNGSTKYLEQTSSHTRSWMLVIVFHQKRLMFRRLIISKDQWIWFNPFYWKSSICLTLNYFNNKRIVKYNWNVVFVFHSCTAPHFGLFQ